MITNPMAAGVPAVMPAAPMGAPAAAPMGAPAAAPMGQAHPQLVQAAQANPGLLAGAVSKYRNGGVEGRAPRIRGRF